ncbi:hypothetical protein EYF80_038322 [Liparis tanakae]|uniref:Uncharacterized protein n=1 Tax=Liparis tanakae TaxID=230148 RepID=A0A4Z2GFN5_9TELE|nr:hypothetical protein EYF80_038322 [Liparis tanakae]
MPNHDKYKTATAHHHTELGDRTRGGVKGLYLAMVLLLVLQRLLQVQAEHKSQQGHTQQEQRPQRGGGQEPVEITSTA